MFAKLIARPVARLQLRQNSGLKEILKAQLPAKQEAMKKLKKDYGHLSLGEVTVDQCIGGGRDVKCMYYETSLLDAQEGIRFRGFSIPELQQKLPTFAGPAGQGEPLPEALIWLLLTSEIPTIAQTKAFSKELAARSALPKHVEPLIRSLPKTMHPMTQLTIALAACQVGLSLPHPSPLPYTTPRPPFPALSTTRPPPPPHHGPQSSLPSPPLPSPPLPSSRINRLSPSSPPPTPRASIRTPTGSTRSRTCWTSSPSCPR